MPGITGFIRRAAADSQPLPLQEMLGSMLHESHYHHGTMVQPEFGLNIGWVCHAGSYSDCLPIWNERHDICLIFSGEHFADNSEIEMARRQGCGGSTDDARWLVGLYEAAGDGFFEKLNGLCCGVVMDLRERKVILFNDRYGLRRIYFHEDKSGFYFASEAKALLKVLPQLRRLDPRGLGEYLSCGCVLQNRTLFEGISILPGGARWTFSVDGTCRKDSYFDARPLENQAGLSAPEYATCLTESFRRVLPRYLDGKQAVGISMTGGIDTRMILAWLGNRGENFPSYTFGGTYRDCADVRLSRRLAKACGLSHQTIPVGSEFLGKFPELAERTVFLGDGTMDVSGAVELYVNQRARDIAPVRLTGNYGSEILRSNVAFRPHKTDSFVFNQEFAVHLRKAGATYIEESQCRRLSFIAFKQVPWHHYSRLAIEQSQLTPRSPFLDNSIVALAFQSPPEAVAALETSLQLIAKGNPEMSRIPTDRGITYPPVPGFTRFRKAWHDYVAKAEYAYDYGMPGWLVRMDSRLSSLQLERLFLGHQKFYHFRVWYRDQLADYLKDVLLDPVARQRSYLQSGSLEKIVYSHVSGNGNFTLELHKLMSIELIHRVLLQSN